MIEIVTFTGVDEGTDLREIQEIAGKYPRAEFGVLLGSQTRKHDNPIFPPVETVRALRDLRGVNTSLHLCGTHARQAAGEEPLDQGLIPLATGFGRVQVNLHGDPDNPARVRLDLLKMTDLAELPGRIILQHRGPWEDIPLDHPRVEYLFDLSEGAGIESFEHWPEPPEGRRVGYAGGIGPHNIRRALEFAGRYPEARIWFDMERNVRTPDYRFDLEKVREVCRLALDGKKR